MPKCDLWVHRQFSFPGIRSCQPKIEDVQRTTYWLLGFSRWWLSGVCVCGGGLGFCISDQLLGDDVSLLVWRRPLEQCGSTVLGNAASKCLRSEAQQCVAEMPRNHQHRVEGVGGGGGIAWAVKTTLVSQPFTWNINGVPTHVNCPRIQLNICYFKEQILIWSTKTPTHWT